MSRSLIDIDQELEQIATAYDALADGGTEEDFLKSLEAYFGDLFQERDAKLDKYADFIAGRLAYAEIRKSEAKRIRALAEADENAAARLKEFLLQLFLAKGWQKQETQFHKFSVSGNGGAAPLIIEPDTDPATVEEFYPELVKTTKVIDGDAVRSYLEKAPDSLPFAKFGERGVHLRIK